MTTTNCAGFPILPPEFRGEARVSFSEHGWAIVEVVGYRPHSDCFDIGPGPHRFIERRWVLRPGEELRTSRPIVAEA